MPISRVLLPTGHPLASLEALLWLIGRRRDIPPIAQFCPARHGAASYWPVSMSTSRLSHSLEGALSRGITPWPPAASMAPLRPTGPHTRGPLRPNPAPSPAEPRPTPHVAGNQSLWHPAHGRPAQPSGGLWLPHCPCCGAPHSRFWGVSRHPSWFGVLVLLGSSLVWDLCPRPRAVSPQAPGDALAADTGLASAGLPRARATHARPANEGMMCKGGAAQAGL